MYYPLNQWKPFCNGLWISSFDQETFKNCTFIFIQCIYNSFVLFIQHPLWSRFPPALAPHIAAVRKTKKSSSRPHNVMVNPMEALCALLSGHFSSQQWKRTWGHRAVLTTAFLLHLVLLQTPGAEPSAFSSVGEIDSIMPHWDFLQTQAGKEPGSLLWNWSGHKRRPFK